MSHQNLLSVFESTASRCAKNIAFKYVVNQKWHQMTWQQAYDEIANISRGLLSLKIESKDAVAILSRTRYEWTLCDLGIMGVGAITVPIYESLTAEQIEFILNDAKVKIIFVENEIQLKKILSVQAKLPHLQQIVVIDPPKRKSASGVYLLSDLLLLGSKSTQNVLATTARSLNKDSIATYVDTSGTTGNPKGVVLTHGNFIDEMEACFKIMTFSTQTVGLLFLPLAHILARLIQFFQVYSGFIHAYAENVEKLMDNIAQTKPHFMVCVPRIFEKIHSKVLQAQESSPQVKRALFDWALETGREYHNAKSPDKILSAKHALAHSLVYRKLHEKLGGRFQFFITGGAPLSQDIGEFFKIFGFKILEGYGLTETTAAITINRPQNIVLGTVGKPLENCQIKIAHDGEILVKGLMVFKGYLNNPEATAEAFDEAGWFKTGDIGEFLPDGSLKITDRKKDIIVTAAGKNVAPQNIENLIKTDPMISQFVVHGDRRKFLSALVTLNQDVVKDFAKSQNISYRDWIDLAQHPQVFKEVEKRIEFFNKQLAKFETIKKFAILTEDFSIESGELTPTLKIKRKEINKNHKNVLDSFYGDS